MQRFAIILFWSAAAFALLVASIPQPIVLPGDPTDKVQHIIAFAVLALLGALAYTGLRLILLLLGLSVFGALIELLQLIPSLNRTADWSDLAADILTLVIVFGAIFVVRRMRRQADG